MLPIKPNINPIIKPPIFKRLTTLNIRATIDHVVAFVLFDVFIIIAAKIIIKPLTIPISPMLPPIRDDASIIDMAVPINEITNPLKNTKVPPIIIKINAAVGLFFIDFDFFAIQS